MVSLFLFVCMHVFGCLCVCPGVCVYVHVEVSMSMCVWERCMCVWVSVCVCVSGYLCVLRFSGLLYFKFNICIAVWKIITWASPMPQLCNCLFVTNLLFHVTLLNCFPSYVSLKDTIVYQYLFSKTICNISFLFLPVPSPFFFLSPKSFIKGRLCYLFMFYVLDPYARVFICDMQRKLC